MEDTQTIRMAGITRDSIVDGPGIRTTLYVQGCPHHCPGCHNPETWDFTTGTDMTVEELFAVVKQNPLCKGVTLSGGEPFAQAGALVPLVERLKAEGYEVASYTGYRFEDLLNGSEDQRRLLETVDVLIDGPFILAERSLDLNFRGSRNQRVLNSRESVRQGKAIAETSHRWLGEY